MSSEETPPPPTNGNGAPIKLSFGGTKGFNLAKKKAPLVNKSASAAFGHQEEKVDAHKDELIAGLDGNKIESLERTEKAQLLVIPKLENADWRQQVLSKRKNIFTPQESGTLPVGTVDETTKEVKYGLQIMKRKRVDQDTEIGDDNMQTETSTLTTTTTIEVMEDILMEQKEETLDEQAARKVIEAATGQRSEEARRLILQGQQNVEDVEAFQKNLEELPDEATLDDYEKVPVEEFGAALLRGMGWNGDIKGSEAIEYNRRPALLGLGAKPKEPEPITKKYIKPGESRIPQEIKVPERHTTGRSESSSNRDNRDSRHGRDSRDSRDATRSRDNRDGRDRENRDSKESRDSRGGDHRRDQRESRSSRDERDDGYSRDRRDTGSDRRRDRSRDRERGDRDRDNRDRERDRDRRRQ